MMTLGYFIHTCTASDWTDDDAWVEPFTQRRCRGWVGNVENKELETFVDVYSGTRRHEKEKNQLRRMPISSTKPVMKDMN